MKIGAHYNKNGTCEFIVWAPLLNRVDLNIVSPVKKTVAMEKDGQGYWKADVKVVSPETRYVFLLDQQTERPDPASHFQPDGVHAPSQVIDHNSFLWQDSAWKGIALQDMIIYELHVGAFTPEGTFDAIISRLEELADIGINAIEIMPVAQFPGERNWGYDGTYPFAVQSSYGGPEGLKRLIDACHGKGIAVILDVVYNHLGPEGNYLQAFAPYFTNKYNTPWGMALNFDDAWSDEVRNYFIENALHWFGNYHIDALRLDAIHAIYDMSAVPFLRELAERVEAFSSEQGRKFFLIAESDRNDVAVLRSREEGGYGLDAQWNDDFHHSLRTLLTDERTGYYMDFGRTGDFVKALDEGFVYSWQYSAYRRRHHGSSSRGIPGSRFVVCSQNHDQVGNRMLGERLAALVSFEALKLAAGSVLLSPNVPLLFMGEEYGEEAPFLYFVSHSDPGLIEAVRKGRREEFRAFAWQGEAPDPQSRETFLKSQINWGNREMGNHGILLNFYRELIWLRKTVPALSPAGQGEVPVAEMEEKVIVMRRQDNLQQNSVFCIFNFNKEDRTVLPESGPGTWTRLLDSSEERWRGPGALTGKTMQSGSEITLRPLSFAVYIKESN